MIHGAGSLAPESVDAVESITVELLNGDSMEVPSSGLRYVAQLREAVSVALECSCHAVVLVRDGCALEDDLCLSCVPTVVAVVNGGWELIRLLQAATRAYEAAVVETNVISGRSRRTVLDDEWHVVGGSQVDAQWMIDEVATTSQVRPWIEEFKVSVESLIEHCDSRSLPCWNGGSCFKRCKHCGCGAARQATCDNKHATGSSQSGINKELAEACRQLRSIVSDNPAGHPQYRFHFAYGRFAGREKIDTACVPCQLRQALPRLMSLRCDLARWGSRNVWYLCLDDSRCPGKAFASQGCACIPGFRHGVIPGMPPPIARVDLGMDLDDDDDDDDDVISHYSYYYDDDYDSGNEHNPNEHPNAWRRWVRPWQREVKAKKSMHTHAYAACKRTKINSLRHYSRAARPRGGRCKEVEHASKLGMDRVVAPRRQHLF